MQPARGPSIWRIKPIEVAIPPLSVGSVFTYRWPKPVYIVSISMYATSNNDSDASNLEFAIEDQNGRQIVSDGFQTQTCPCLALMGKGLRRFTWAGHVANLDSWNIQFLNNDAARTITPMMLVEFEDDPS